MREPGYDHVCGRLTARGRAVVLGDPAHPGCVRQSAAGVPLYGESGHDGGYRILGGFRTRLTGLTADEADSLFLAGIPTAAADLGMGAVAAAVQLKLMASLPAELRDRAGRIAQRFHLDAPRWYHEADRTPHLGAVADESPRVPCPPGYLSPVGCSEQVA